MTILSICTTLVWTRKGKIACAPDSKRQYFGSVSQQQGRISNCKSVSGDCELLGGRLLTVVVEVECEKADNYDYACSLGTLLVVDCGASCPDDVGYQHANVGPIE